MGIFFGKVGAMRTKRPGMSKAHAGSWMVRSKGLKAQYQQWALRALQSSRVVGLRLSSNDVIECQPLEVPRSRCRLVSDAQAPCATWLKMPGVVVYFYLCKTQVLSSNPLI